MKHKEDNSLSPTLYSRSSAITPTTQAPNASFLRRSILFLIISKSQAEMLPGLSLWVWWLRFIWKASLLSKSSWSNPVNKN